MADNVIVRVPEQQFIRGEDGYSPEVTIEDIAHGHSVTITDRDHPTGQSFNVLDGDSAYEQAVAGGYTGTETQFNEELANFNDLSEQAADSAAAAAQSESNAAGSATTATTKAQEAADSAAQALIRMNSAATSAQTAEDASSFFTSTILPNAVNTINSTRDQAVANVNVAKSTAVHNVQAEGATQVSAVQTESTTQQAAIQQKGEDVLESIPSDYTELTEDVDDLKSAFDSAIPQNLFNGVVSGKWISATGAIISSERSAYTKSIEVAPNSVCNVGFTITLNSNLPQNHFVRIHGYDSSDSWVSQLWYKEFQNNYSGSQIIAISVPNNVKYIRVSFFFYDIISNLFVAYDGYRRPYMQGFVQIQYPIDNDGHYTKGRIALPTNYTDYGVPVPLIVYVHPSNAFGSIDGNIYTSDTGLSNLQFLLDSGYAIFDCYGWGNVYPNGGFSNTWGLPINRKCYKSGVEHVLKNYNIDRENIFCSCKSLGGLQAASMFFDSGIPIKGFGLLAPELSILTLKLGYSAGTKKTVAADLGFSEDVNNVLNFGQSDPVPEGFWDYVTENMEKWSGWFSIFNGLPISKADKPSYYTSPSSLGSMSRQSLNRPIKIWIASDDNTVVYSKSKAFIDSLVNGGNIAQLRTMPANTGGHAAVDVSPDRLMTQDVTTRLGVHWDSITTAYVELVEWFDMLCTR